MKSILVCSQDKTVFQSIRSRLAEEFEIAWAADNDKALAVLKERPFDFLLIDLDLLRASDPDQTIKTTLQSFWQLRPAIEVIVMTYPERLRDAVMAVRAGASNYLTYPLEPAEVKYVVESVYDFKLLTSELEYLRGQFWEPDSLDFVRTDNALMKVVFEKVRNVASTRASVLLVGETGTGKGVLARMIHRHSNRRNQPFVSVHCGAIPDTLLESELFGHEKGAFTGAIRRKLGKFEIARGGTIFLDEVATLMPSAQIMLLQILQEGLFQRVGGEDTLKADVRIISATNLDLLQLTNEGSFRKDLYYRLNAFPIEIPPLRDRREDIEVIVSNIIEKLNKIHAKEIKGIDPEAMQALKNYSWPGNIRELENMVERAYILASSHILSHDVFPPEIFPDKSVKMDLPINTALTLEEVRNRAIQEIEASFLRQLLAKNKGRIDKTARDAGIGTRHLHALMRKYDLHKEDFKESSARLSHGEA